MDSIFSSSQSPLDSLVFDSVTDPLKPLDMETKENLELWTNVQFTHDVQPGSGLYNDSIKSPLSSVSSQESTSAASSNSLSNITYESLANYLDFELPKQHLTVQIDDQNKQQQQQSRRQLLLPKIPSNATLEEITKVLFSSIPNTAAATTTTKIPITSTTAKISKEKSAVEEEKRKRNTAASARFRIKKKQKEQSMEQTVRELTQKSSGLENRVKELELEIKFLRGLLIEKKQDEENAN
ncbi:hypothetical protein BD408DRAFT_418586 [Parasitella parasitica]|nr:hypothetical protein BD408DRAFT_418586 [Parasitella parasitica]